MSPPPGRQVQFQLWHLFVLVFAAAVVLSGFLNIVSRLGMKSASVEITGLTDEPNRSQLEYTVRYHNGTSWSATLVPSEIPEARFRQLFGRQFQIQYRATQILWLEPDLPVAVANRAVQQVIKDFAAQQVKPKVTG